MTTPHDEHWTRVKRETESRVCALFEGHRTTIAEIVGHGGGIETPDDAKRVLSHVLCRGNADEKACAILSLATWTHAFHELGEHVPAGAGT